MSLVEITEQNYQKEVVESGLPTIIEFYDQKCDVCKMLLPICEKVSNEYEGKAKWGKCNRYENSEIARKLGIIVASQIAVVYKGQKIGIIPGASVSLGGAHGAVKEERLKEKINGYLESIIKK